MNTSIMLLGVLLAGILTVGSFWFLPQEPEQWIGVVFWSITILAAVCFAWMVFEYFTTPREPAHEGGALFDIGEAEEVSFDNHKVRTDRQYLRADRITKIEATNMDIKGSADDRQ